MAIDSDRMCPFGNSYRDPLNSSWCLKLHKLSSWSFICPLRIWLTGPMVAIVVGGIDTAWDGSLLFLLNVPRELIPVCKLAACMN